jgi:hypothetical protein
MSKNTQVNVSGSSIFSCLTFAIKQMLLPPYDTLFHPCVPTNHGAPGLRFTLADRTDFGGCLALEMHGEDQPLCIWNKYVEDICVVA